MVTVSEALRRTRNDLEGIYSSGEAKTIAGLLFEHRFNLLHKDIIMHPDKVFEDENEWKKCLDLLMLSHPIQHLIGFEQFAGMKIKVNSNVLIPRPETEELFRWMLKSLSDIPSVIADFCTGSGCLALALSKQFPEAEIFAADISEESLSLAEESEKSNFEVSRIHWIQQDVLKEDWAYSRPDLIVCNPPYILTSEKDTMEKNVLAFEPHKALFVYDDDALLFYKTLISRFSDKPVPVLFFELNPKSAVALKTWCESIDLNCEIGRDISGKQRFAKITG